MGNKPSFTRRLSVAKSVKVAYNKGVAVLKNYQLKKSMPVTPGSPSSDVPLETPPPTPIHRNTHSEKTIVIALPVSAPLTSTLAEPINFESDDNPEIDHPKADLIEISAEISQYRTQKMTEIDRELDHYYRTKKSEIDAKIDHITQTAQSSGYADGKAQGQAELASACRDIFTHISLLQKEKQSVLENSKSAILSLALKIAGEIIQSEITVNQAICINIVAEAINKMIDRDKVIIKANHADAEYLKTHRDELLNLIGEIKHLTILDDSRIEPGGCIIETDMGYIDATIHTKMTAVENAISKVSADLVQ